MKYRHAFSSTRISPVALYLLVVVWKMVCLICHKIDAFGLVHCFDYFCDSYRLSRTDCFCSQSRLFIFHCCHCACNETCSDIYFSFGLFSTTLKLFCRSIPVLIASSYKIWYLICSCLSLCSLFWCCYHCHHLGFHNVILELWDDSCFFRDSLQLFWDYLLLFWLFGFFNQCIHSSLMFIHSEKVTTRLTIKINL